MLRKYKYFIFRNIIFFRKSKEGIYLYWVFSQYKYPLLFIYVLYLILLEWYFRLVFHFLFLLYIGIKNTEYFREYRTQYLKDSKIHEYHWNYEFKILKKLLIFNDFFNILVIFLTTVKILNVDFYFFSIFWKILSLTLQYLVSVYIIYFLNPITGNKFFYVLAQTGKYAGKSFMGYCTLYAGIETLTSFSVSDLTNAWREHKKEPQFLNTIQFVNQQRIHEIEGINHSKWSLVKPGELFYDTNLMNERMVKLKLKPSWPIDFLSPDTQKSTWWFSKKQPLVIIDPYKNLTEDQYLAQILVDEEIELLHSKRISDEIAANKLKNTRK